MLGVDGRRSHHICMGLEEAYRIPAGPAYNSTPSNGPIHIHTAGACHKVDVGNKECKDVNNHQHQLQHDQHIGPVPSMLPAGAMGK